MEVSSTEQDGPKPRENWRESLKEDYERLANQTPEGVAKEVIEKKEEKRQKMIDIALDREILGLKEDIQKDLERQLPEQWQIESRTVSPVRRMLRTLRLQLQDTSSSLIPLGLGLLNLTLLLWVILTRSS